jgi:carboxyl-terminal processing protease
MYATSEDGKKIPLSFKGLEKAPIYGVFGRPIILVDSNTASAAEILAGSLQDLHRALLVGENTYGKGTMQQGMPWADGPADIATKEVTIDGKAQPEVVMLRTQTRFQFASGRSNQLAGLTPDFEVYSVPNPTDMDKYALRERDNSNVIPGHKGKFTPDKATIAKSKKCMDQRRDTFAGNDYQLWYAEVVAACQ